MLVKAICKNLHGRSSRLARKFPAAVIYVYQRVHKCVREAARYLHVAYVHGALHAYRYWLSANRIRKYGRVPRTELKNNRVFSEFCATNIAVIEANYRICDSQIPHRRSVWNIASMKTVQSLLSLFFVIPWLICTASVAAKEPRPSHKGTQLRIGWVNKNRSDQ